MAPAPGEHSENAVVTSSRWSVTMNNPKAEPTDNAQKDPDEWLSAEASKLIDEMRKKAGVG
jgi:hypothetical protein